MKKVTYEMQLANKVTKRGCSTEAILDKKYDKIEIKKKGMQINLEFPPKSARDYMIEQEVKAIISGELKEKSRKIYVS